jgi:hypothetical protein
MEVPIIIEAELIVLVEDLKTLRTQALIALKYPRGIQLCIMDVEE